MTVDAPGALSAGLLVAALAVLAVTVSGRVPAGRRPPLWVACGLFAAAGCTLLMDVVGLLFGQGVDSWFGAAVHALGLAGAVRTAVAAGREPGRERAAVPVRPGRWTGYVGVVSFLPYIAMKLHWALGGTFAGVRGDEVLAASERNGASGLWLTLEWWGLDGTVLLALAGILLLFCLLRPWGPRLPRWLVLTPALIGAGTLVPYGLLGLGYLVLAQAGVVTVRTGDFHSTGAVLLVGWIGFAAFAGYGVALLSATRWYWRRTRPGAGAGAVRPPRGAR
ncbi:hypothetical protein [Streptomyces sp. G-G2]|uniref:hypothetical protein n=1 Tax=Streptomyces sp. G-G2 TaxID=3046201 RepID=UPI0024B87AE5|nr:hypothetical protein [Streptomyces sp. G-G2]MDJ0379267.1 hypothetical protein [Streptomyces sp. G-G2]